MIFLRKDKNNFIYKKDGQEHSINEDFLRCIFKTYGYCVDPSDKKRGKLTEEAIDSLISVSAKYGDKKTLALIGELHDKKAISPRVETDVMMFETLSIEKKRFKSLDSKQRHALVNLLREILKIGLLLGGWKGDDEPMIDELYPVVDQIRVELKIIPLIHHIFKDVNYPLIKNFPIIIYEGKPIVYNNTDNIDIYLNRIISGDYNKREKDVSSRNEMIRRLIPDFSSEESKLCDGEKCDKKSVVACLITTVYYYLENICEIPLINLQPLINSLS